MSFEFERKVIIDAGHKRVWAVLCDLERWPEWTPSMTEVRVLGAQTGGVGTKVLVKQPELQACILTITEWKPGAGFEWENRSLVLHTRAVHWIQETDLGCAVTLSIRFDGLLAPLVGRFVGARIRDYVNLEADGLKQVCERLASKS